MEVMKDKRKTQQDDLPKVICDDEEVLNCRSFEYLGSILQPDGDQKSDVKKTDHNGEVKDRKIKTHTKIRDT